MEAQLQQLRQGNITFEEFERATRQHWQRLAQHLCNRWRPPASMDADDLVQEMLCAVLDLLPRWNSKRGSSLQGYVVWNACSVAKTYLHRQRKALKLRDKAPSRAPVPVDPQWLQESTLLCAPPPQAEIDQLIDAMKLATTDRERAIMGAVVEHRSVDLAVRALLADAPARERLQLRDRKAATREVKRAVQEFAARASG